MIVFDSNRNNKWVGRGFTINKNSVIVYKNAGFRHKINLEKGSYNLRIFSRNRTGASPLLFKVMTEKNNIISSGRITLSKTWSDENIKFEVKTGGIGYVQIYRDDISYGSIEIGRILLNKEETVSSVKRARKKRKLPEVHVANSVPAIRKHSKRKIGFVIPYSMYGGAEVYLETIINNIDSNMFQMHIIYIKDNPIRISLTNKAVIHKKASSAENMINYIKSKKLDFLVYYNSFSAYKLCQRAAKESSHSTKLIEIYHSDFKWSDSLSNLNARNNVDIAFRTSPNYLNEVSGIKHLVNLPVPIDIDKFKQRDIDKLLDLRGNIPVDKFIVGVVSRLSAEKNLDYVLDIAKSGDEFNFLIFGEGNHEKHLKARVETEQITNVHFMGFKRDMFKYYNFFDAFLLTSKMEGTPISILESMAMGVPVFTTNVGEIKSIIKDKHTGFFLSGDPIVDQGLIAEELFNYEVTDAARKYIEDNHDQNIITTKFIHSMNDIHNHFTKKQAETILSGEYV